MRASSHLSAYFTNIPRGQKIALSVIFGIIVVIVYWQVFLQSAWTARSDAKTEWLRLRAEVEQTRQRAGQRPRLEQEIKLLEAQLDRTIQQLPTEKEIPKLLKRVASLGQEADLNVTLFKPGAAVAKEFYTEVPVQLKVTGGYHNLGLLFERLGRLERIVNVADLTIRQAAKGQRATDTIQAEFGVVTYTYTGAVGGKSGEAASAVQ